MPGCPSTEGGHNWQAMSYYQPGNRIIAPLSQTCLEMNGQNVERWKAVALVAERCGADHGWRFGFRCDLNREFKAVDANNGKILWQTRLITSVQGFPLSFGIGGKQYIATRPDKLSRLTRSRAAHPTCARPLSQERAQMIGRKEPSNGPCRASA